MTVLGNNSKTTDLIIESHKMFIEFPVANGATVQNGQPVALNTDGTIRPWVAADTRVKMIGYAFTSGYATNLVTVYVRAYSWLQAVSAGTVNAGPATYTGYSTTPLTSNGTSGFNIYDNSVDPTLVNGFILTPATGANQLIQVMVF